MTNQEFRIVGVVELFPQVGGWHYVQVPLEYTEMTRAFAERGLVAVRATLGQSSWNTSLLPKGDGSHFIALPQKLRRQENVALGQEVVISFSLRKR